MNTETIYFTPLGGLKQIGSNMMLIETHSASFLIDCGILFSNDEAFDIEHLFPDLSFIKNDPEYLIITHAHEDHIGGVSHIVKKYPNIKIYASEFTSIFLKKKIDKIKIEKNIIIFRYNDILEIGDLKIQQIHFNHSIPETRGLFISNKDICLLYISDFKIDFAPEFEEKTDLSKLKLISKDFKKRFLLADSTNVLSKNEKTPGENTLLPVIQNIIKEHEGRVFITFFASNIFRLKYILKISSNLNKKVYLHGRSMLSAFHIAIESGILGDEKSCVINPEGEDDFTFDDKKIVILLAGCQADLKSSFRRVAQGEDKIFIPQNSDLFIMSSKSIPGNEKKITNALNSISETGAKIIMSEVEHVHVSGHPGKEDLKILIDEFAPTDYLPIHGESVLLDFNAKFVKSLSRNIHTHKIKNYDTLIISATTTSVSVNNTPPIPILYHGEKIVPLEKDKLNERKKIARSGLVIITIFDAKKFLIKTLGICDLGNSQNEKLERILKTELPYILKRDSDFQTIEKDLKITVRKHYNQLIGQKPVVIVQLI